MKWMLALVAVLALVMWTGTGYGAILFNEGFDGYQTGTRPAGWTFTGCNDDTDTYTAAGMYGVASPSVSLDATGDQIVTETVLNPMLIQFWVRGTGTQNTSALLVEEYYTGSWHTLFNINPIPTVGTPEAFASGVITSQYRLTYTQFLGEGNVAIDDIQVDRSDGTPTPIIPTPTAPIIPTPTAPIIPTPTAPIIPTPTAPIMPTPTAPIIPTPTAAPVIPTPTAGPITPTPVTVPTPRRYVFDAANFDGAGGDDIAIWRGSDATNWRVRNISLVGYGMNGDIPVTGDYNGDGTADYAVWRPSSGRWWVRGLYNGVPYSNFYFGQLGDIPVPADYDGDFRTDTAVWRPANGYWAIKSQTRFYYGINGDVPVPADYNGDGRADPAVFRPSALGAVWYIRGISTRAWGLAGDSVAPGDYNGDGTTELSVLRGYAGRWYVLGSPVVTFGQTGDIPVVIDYEGDGTEDRVLYRPSEGNWYIYGVTTITYGVATDVPAVGKTN